MKNFQYGGRHRAIGTMWLTMWPVTWPTEANENTRVARGTLSAITVGSSNLCTGPNFRAAASNIVVDQNFSVVLDLINFWHDASWRYAICHQFSTTRNIWTHVLFATLYIPTCTQILTQIPSFFPFAFPICRIERRSKSTDVLDTEFYDATIRNR